MPLTPTPPPHPDRWLPNPGVYTFIVDKAIDDGQIAMCIAGTEVYVAFGPWAKAWLQNPGGRASEPRGSARSCALPTFPAYGGVSPGARRALPLADPLVSMCPHTPQATGRPRTSWRG
jgi:hypothetical protein